MRRAQQLLYDYFINVPLKAWQPTRRTGTKSNSKSRQLSRHKAPAQQQADDQNCDAVCTVHATPFNTHAFNMRYLTLLPSLTADAVTFIAPWQEFWQAAPGLFLRFLAGSWVNPG
jgi:hypothetical protein